MLATELYAMTEGKTCQGPERCHWCGAPCGRDWIHDDPHPMPFVKTPPWARCPGNGWICVGCWLFRRKRVTIRFLGGGFRDGQCPQDHSWLITDGGATAIRRQDYSLLPPILLKPPRRFVLAIRNGTDEPNHIQLAPVNDPFGEILAETPLKFLIDNHPAVYNAYELANALEHGAAGREPGVRSLVKLIAPEKLDAEEPEEEKFQLKRGRGRPPTETRVERGPKNLIRASGV